MDIMRLIQAPTSLKKFQKNISVSSEELMKTVKTKYSSLLASE